MLLRTAQTRLADTPKTAGLRRQLLQDAIAFYERLTSSAGGDDARVREARARVQVRLGARQLELGAVEPAIEQLTQAHRTLAGLLPASDHPDVLRADMARCDDSLVVAYGRSDRPAELAAAVERALAVYRDLAARLGENRFVEGELRTSLSRAKCVGSSGDRAGAAAALDELDRRLAEPDERVRALPLLTRLLLAAEVADQRGVFHAQRGETAQAVDAFRESLRRIDSVPAEDANDDDVVKARLGELERMALIHHQRREWDVAQPLLDRACSELERLGEAEPEYRAWRYRLARMLKTRATNCRHRGDTTACRADHDRAIELLDVVVTESPEDAEGRRSLALAFAERASFRLETRDPPGAFADFERAQREFDTCLQAAPDNLQTAANLSAALCNHAIARTRTRDWAAAQPLIDRALELNRTLTGREAERSAIEILCLASDVALQLEDVDGAQRHMLDAVQRAKTMLEHRPDDASAMGTAVYLAINHGTMLLSLRRPDEALAVWNERLPLAERVGAMTSFGRLVHGTLLLRIADVHARQGRLEQAREAFSAALRAGATRAQVAQFPPLPDLFDRPDFADLLQQAGAEK